MGFQLSALAQQDGGASVAGTLATGVIDSKTRKAVIDSLARKLISDYAYADVGAKLAATIQANLKAKSYDRITSSEEFARKLTDDLYAAAHDKHLSVRYDTRPLPSFQQGIPPEAIARMRKSNGSILNWKSWKATSAT
jgi:hypothetical protein